MDLGQVDSFNASQSEIAYTPVTNTTLQIMNIVASASFMKGEFSSNLRILDVNIWFI